MPTDSPVEPVVRFLDCETPSEMRHVARKPYRVPMSVNRRDRGLLAEVNALRNELPLYLQDPDEFDDDSW